MRAAKCFDRGEELPVAASDGAGQPTAGGGAKVLQ